MNRNGFTLIELLIVIAILGVLAAIAVPNYQDAMMKSRVLSAKMDLRALGQALDSYRIDHNIYPRRNQELFFFAQYLLPDLTSPVAYLNPVKVTDPFGPVAEYEEVLAAEDEVFAPPGVDGTDLRNMMAVVKNSYTYTPYVNFSYIQSNPNLRREGFAVSSVGPDQNDSYLVDYPFPDFYRFSGRPVRDSVYNPSNGLISPGDIGYFGGNLSVQGLIGG